MKFILCILVSCVLSLLCAGQEPRLECEKRWGEAKYKGKRIVRYRLRGNGFPEGNRFRLVVKWFNGEEADTYSYIASRSGHLLLEEGRQDEPIYALCPLKRGERIAFLMRCEEDPSCCAEASVVPFPLAYKTKSGLKISLELKGEDGDAFRLLGRGFLPQEHFEISTLFQKKNCKYSLIASSEGKVDFPLIFELDDREGGECTATLKRAEEEVIFSFLAGRAALELAGGFVLEIR